MKRAGFTMIELIFVIVILGILAAVAIPKLAATRADATASQAIANARTCVSDLKGEAVGTGVTPTVITGSAACVAAHAVSGVSVTISSNDVIIAGTVGGDADGTFSMIGTAVTRP